MKARLTILFLLAICQYAFLNHCRGQVTSSVTSLLIDTIGQKTKATDTSAVWHDPEMVLVDSGTFVMGCTGGATADWFGRVEACQTNENPVHLVTLSSYKIGKNEVTQAEWRSIMGENPSHHKRCNQCPVEEVSWNEVQEFLEKLNETTGKHYQLPTEAQWEYAARGGQRSKGYLFAGSNEMAIVAWWGQKEIVTYPVGLKQPNELGIHDMTGNVWEWCSDWFGAYDMKAQTNPRGPLSGSAKIIRGGSGRHEDLIPRVYTRNYALPGEHSKGIGFRLVLAQD
jgi:formylglycine-generating enzyme required for sulfatase activity